MKKLLPVFILLVLAMLMWDAVFDPFHMAIQFDDTDVDGPLGDMLAAALTGSGLLIGLLVVLMAGVVLAVVFAGVGVAICGALLLAATVTGLALLPLLLPLLIPIAIIWYLMVRDRNRRPQGNPVTPT